MPFQKGNQLFLLRNKSGLEGRFGIAHPNWKGDAASYKSIHEWVRKYLPRPMLCKCGVEKPREVSNNDGKYSRILSTWEWLCVSCHRLKDYDRLRKERGYAKAYAQA